MSWQTVDGAHEGHAAIEVPGGHEVTGIQGDTLILDDGTKVSISETAGWRARCTCSWKAELMIERVTDRDVEPKSHQAFDPEGGPAPKWVETTCHTEWLDHVRPENLKSVCQAAEASRASDRSLDEAVAAARESGASWADIGDAVGISRQSAHVRWRRFDATDQ
ncbi:AsnC family protein [Rhodococcus sp. TAF43]|uniref:AsnC family protein n=1 Tax=Rhodococcus sp. TAF43 TaxID=3237483 RepID=UPI003F94F8CF